MKRLRMFHRERTFQHRPWRALVAVAVALVPASLFFASSAYADSSLITAVAGDASGAATAAAVESTVAPAVAASDPASVEPAAAVQQAAEPVAAAAQPLAASPAQTVAPVVVAVADPAKTVAPMVAQVVEKVANDAPQLAAAARTAVAGVAAPALDTITAAKDVAAAGGGLKEASSTDAKTVLPSGLSVAPSSDAERMDTAMAGKVPGTSAVARRALANDARATAAHSSSSVASYHAPTASIEAAGRTSARVAVSPDPARVLFPPLPAAPGAPSGGPGATAPVLLLLLGLVMASSKARFRPQLSRRLSLAVAPLRPPVLALSLERPG